MSWEEILYFFVALAMSFMLYNFARNQRGAFSSENFVKTMYTLGILALGLIVFIGYCVWMLGSSQNY